LLLPGLSVALLQYTAKPRRLRDHTGWTELPAVEARLNPRALARSARLLGASPRPEGSSRLNYHVFTRAADLMDKRP